MKGIGTHLKLARIRKKLSRVKLEGRTKVRSSFIKAIEDENWEILPDYPVVVGFVKSISQTLGLDKDSAMALLRRDYPPKKLNPNPKPDVADKFSWSPKATFISGVVVVSVLILGYLVFQYINYIRPPQLEIYYPLEGENINRSVIKVEGKTDEDTSVFVNNQPALVSDDGYFWTEIGVERATERVEIVAKTRSGKETRITREINVELE